MSSPCFTFPGTSEDVSGGPDKASFSVVVSGNGDNVVHDLFLSYAT